MVTDIMLEFNEFCTKLDDLGLVRRVLANFSIVVVATNRHSSLCAPLHHQRNSASASGDAWSALARIVDLAFRAAGEVESIDAEHRWLAKTEPGA